MATDTELAIRLEARIRDFERNMAKAEKRADRTYREMTKGSARVAQRVENDMSGAAGRITAAFSTMGKGLVAGLSVGAVTAATASIGQLAGQIAAVGDAAKQAGLGVEEFQELKFVAEQNRIEMDDLSAGIREMQLRMSEFIATAGKSGSAAGALRELGYSVEEIEEKLRNPVDLLTEIIGKVEHLSKARQIRIFDEIFGGDGERLVRLISEGERGIRDQIKAARDLGIVMDEELIQKAEELDRQFKVVTQTVGTGLKTAIVNAASAMAGFIDSFRAMENQQTRTIQNSLGDVYGELDAAKQSLEDLRSMDSVLPNPFNSRNISDAEARIESLTQKALKLRDTLDRRQGYSEDFVYNPADYEIPPPPPADTGSGGSGSGGSGRASTASATRDTTDAIREQITALEEELRLVGATDLQYAIAAEMRRAGADATAEQEARIASLVTAIHAEEQAVRNATDAQREMRDLGKDVLGGFVSDLRNGTSAAEALSNALGKIADKLLEMALNSAFGSGGPLSFLGFGGGSSQLAIAQGGGIGLYDQGGFTGQGGKYDPAGIVHKGEYVFDQEATRRIGVANLTRLHKGYADGGYVGAPRIPSLRSAASPSATSGYVDNSVYNIDARGAQRGVSEEITAAIAAYDRRRKKAFQGGARFG